jgi:uncharacterized protein (TIGR00645 family)
MPTSDEPPLRTDNWRNRPNKPLGSPPGMGPRNTKTRDDYIDDIGEATYAIRWGLVPMYFGLWIAIVLYNLHFFREIIDFIFEFDGGIHLKHNNSNDYVIWILSLIDVTMIGNLMVMTTVGGYSTFVKEFRLDRLANKPRWMNGLDSSQLKIKTGMSLIMISGINLLRIYMETGKVTWDQLLQGALMVGVFSALTVVFTFNAWLNHFVHATAGDRHA